MIKKTFIQCMFGEPWDWIDKYIDNVQLYQSSGWNWKIFTPNKILSRGNVEIIPMTAEDFSSLVEKKLGVRPNMFITSKGVPSVHITDYYVASGIIFEDYLKDSDFWGITNLDVVYGRLNHFLPDTFLDQFDVFTDDTNIVNGVFSLWRNNPIVNNLFRYIPDWPSKFAQQPCKKCLGEEGDHTLFGTDEYDMTEVMRKPEVLAVVRYGFPNYFPLHGHDRLEQHIPTPKLKLYEDGSLWELSADIGHPNWIHAHPYIGREIMYFHFPSLKKWPL